MADEPLILPEKRAYSTSVPTQFRHTVHCYHGVNAWSRDGSKLLYAGIDEPGKAAVVVQQLDTGEETILACDVPANFHTAARQRWCFDDTAVCFGSLDDYDTMCPTICHLDSPEQPQPLTKLNGFGIRHICDDGIHASGCVGGDEPMVARINLQDQSVEKLATAKQCIRELPERLHDKTATYSFTHPVYSPDESRLFFKLMAKPADGPQRFCAFFVLHLNPRRLLCFGDRISGHPYWVNDSRYIINVKSPRDGSDNRWLVLVDSETGEDFKLVDQPIEGPGHPSQSPCGQYIVTDSFTADGRSSALYLVDLKTHVTREIIRLLHRFEGTPDQTSLYRGQPHPVWSPCGKKLIVNCNQGGAQYRMFILEDFLT